jgi:hypothetical protein
MTGDGAWPLACQVSMALSVQTFGCGRSTLGMSMSRAGLVSMSL